MIDIVIVVFVGSMIFIAEIVSHARGNGSVHKNAMIAAQKAYESQVQFRDDMVALRDKMQLEANGGRHT